MCACAAQVLAEDRVNTADCHSANTKTGLHNTEQHALNVPLDGEPDPGSERRPCYVKISIDFRHLHTSENCVFKNVESLDHASHDKKTRAKVITESHPVTYK